MGVCPHAVGLDVGAVIDLGASIEEPSGGVEVAELAGDMKPGCSTALGT